MSPLSLPFAHSSAHSSADTSASARHRGPTLRSRLAAVLAALGLAVAATVAGPAVRVAAESPCAPSPQYTTCVQFDYTGGDQTFVVPAGVTSLRVSVYGGQGEASALPTPGGLGGLSQGTVATTPGTTYTVTVGAMGGAGSYGGGGIAGTSGRAPGGDGGGLSAIWAGGAFSTATAVIIAGGGGGSSGANAGAPEGGDGGGLLGEAAGPVPGVGGGGGTQTAGGAGGVFPSNATSGSAGSQFQGANSADVGDGSGGAGGGGWFGGGSGAGQRLQAGGDSNTSGGGGSGYLAPSVTAGSSTVGVRAGAGLVVIEFTPATTVITTVTDGQIIHGTFVVDGTAIPGNTVTLTIDGTPVCSTTADGAGSWSCGTFARAPGAHAIVASEADPARPLVVYPTASLGITVVAPTPPVVGPTAGVTVTGTAEAGTTVEVRDSSGTFLGSAVAAPDGSFAVTLSSAQPHGSVLSVTAVDTANSSSPTLVTVDALAPDAPLVDPTNGQAVSGSAEPGATVVVRDPGGTAVGSAVAAPDGSFSVTLSPVQPHGATLSVTATDAAGNVSPATAVTVDALAPTAPDLEPTRGVTVSGTAEPASAVTVRDSSGAIIGTGTAAGDGSFTISLSPAQPHGSVLSVTSGDAAGNVSPAASVTVDAVAPAAPVVEPSNGQSVSGTAEPGALVEVRTSVGTLIGTGMAAPDGSFAIVLSPTQLHGVVLSVTASDAAGNVSSPTSVTVDAAAPSAPVPDPTDGGAVTGTAEAGSTVEVRNSSGSLVGSAVTAPDGSFSVTLTPVQPDGEVLSVRSVDASGNTSAPASVTVDAVAPGLPDVDPSDGRTVSGTAEPGATIEVRDASGAVIGTGTADVAGVFTITLTPAQPDGAVLAVVATDEAGNPSAPASVTVDAVDPAAPTVDPTGGRVVSGLAEPGATVTVRDPSGTVIGSGTAGPDGAFAFMLSPAQPDGVLLSVVASDAAGNDSAPTEVTVDAVAPGAPVCDPSNGTVVSGTAEPGSTVIVRDPDGGVIGTATAAGDGSFSVVLSPARPDGDVLAVTATDTAGNESAAVQVTVDADPPAAPAVDPTNGQTASGTAEPGATVEVRDASGALLGSGTAAGDGTFSIVLSPVAPHGSVLSVTASDAVGNTSTPTEATVDALAPAAPTVEPSNGRTLTGAAEPGSRVEVRDASGALLGTVVAGPDGSFTVTLSPAAADGAVLSITATDAAGNTSAPSEIDVDAAPPVPPALDPSDGLTVSGTAEAGSLVVVRGPTGAALGSALAGPDGTFTIVLSPAQHDGVVVSATAADDLDNTSPASNVTVDVPVPALPTDVLCAENPTGTVTCSGRAAPGLIVTVRDANGGPVCSVVVAANGSWSCTSAGPVNHRPLSITIADPRGSAAVVDDVAVRPRPAGLASTGSSPLGDLAGAVAVAGFGLVLLAIRRRRPAQPRDALTAS